uniref:G-protein coupled receptors family 3 profile domain-containing protein n=1 Tax=Sciurus vulgaris TaxID=55149 RepID=A0A8D2JT64_SCIVU
MQPHQQCKKQLQIFQSFMLLQNFPMSNGKNYQLVLALVFAIEEINRNPHILPNMSLGFDLYTIPDNESNVLESFFFWLLGLEKVIPNYTCRRESKSVAVLLGATRKTSSQTGLLLELYKFPQITFGPFDHALSDPGQFPSLYQMAPRDTSLALCMVSLLLHFHWTWVGLLISEDQKGIQILSDLKREMEQNGVCAAFVKVIPEDTEFSLHLIIESSANVIIIYSDTNFVEELLFAIGQYFMTWKVWVTNSRWQDVSKMKHLILDSSHGMLMFSHYHGEIPGFTELTSTVNPSKFPEDIYLARLWHFCFGSSYSKRDCQTLENCPQNASWEWVPEYVFDMSLREESYNIYNAVYAVAHTLHEMLLQLVDTPKMVSALTLGHAYSLNIVFLQLHPILKKLKFENIAGEQVTLDEKMKLETEYVIHSFWNFPEGLSYIVKVGNFSPYAPHGQQLSLQEDLIEWSIGFTQTPRSVCTETCGPGFRKSPQEGKAACCFNCHPCPENEISNETDMDQCVKCPDHQYANTERNQCLQRSVTFLAYQDPLGMALACTAVCLSVLTSAVLGVFVRHQHTPIVKANNRALSYILLISLTFCFLCSLLFIGPPNTATCTLQPIAFGLVFTVAVSTVLAKTVTVILAFKVTAPGRRMRRLLVSGAPNFIIPSCSLIQLTLCGVWLGTSPPFVDSDTHSEHGHIIITCNKGSVTAFYCGLGYLGSLALGTFMVAFLARNLPDTFNEAKFLTFSMLVFCSVWLTFLPVHHSTKGKVMVAVEVFSILASSAGLLGCIFAPKCYVILLKPHNHFAKFSFHVSLRILESFCHGL